MNDVIGGLTTCVVCRRSNPIGMVCTHSESVPAPTTPFDPVQKPAHYNQGKVECIDAIEAATIGLTGIEAVEVGAVIKYVWRWKFKNGLEDLKKCRWYLDKLIEHVEGGKS